MSKHLEFKKISSNNEPHLEQVIFKSNGKNIGEVFRDVDGEHYFQPTGGGGAWTGYVLMEIGIHLSLLNTRTVRTHPIDSAEVT